MYEKLNILRHINCCNCGKCCQEIPVLPIEVTNIQRHLDRYPNIARIANNKTNKEKICPFRDESFKQCLIYPVRPLICRIFGVSSGMECYNGNTANENYLAYYNFFGGAPDLWLGEITWIERSR